MGNTTGPDQQSPLFDPDDLTLWRDTPPDEFIAIIVHDIKMEGESISKFAELLAESPEMESITWQAGDETVTAKFWLEAILRATSRMNVLFSTLSAYGRNLGNEQS